MVFLFMVILQTAAYAVPLFVLYMGWRFLQAYERRPRGDLGDATNARLARLEEGMLRIDSELITLSEQQRFLTRLLGDRQDAPK